MKKSYVIAATIAVATTAWVLSGQFETTAAPAPEPRAETEAETRERPAVRVVDLQAERMTDTVVLNGRTEAARTVELRAEARGRVEEVLVERGARVEAGTPILRIAVNERKAALAEAQALLEQRRVEYEAAQALGAKGFQSDIKVAEAKAKLDAAQAQLAEAEINLAKTTVVAPFAGVLAERPVEKGAYLDIGSPVARLIELDPLRVVGYATERQVYDLAPDAPGLARFLNGQEIEGRLAYIAPSADPATRTFRIELEVPNPAAYIKDGLTAQIRVPVQEQLAQRIPPSVLTLADDGTIGVKLVDEAGRVRFTPIRILGEAQDGIWVDGLPKKARLIVVGQEFVVDGQAVRPVVTAGVP